MRLPRSVPLVIAALSVTVSLQIVKADVPPQPPFRFQMSPTLSVWKSGHWHPAFTVHEGDHALVTENVSMLRAPSGGLEPGWTHPVVRFVLYKHPLPITAGKDIFYARPMRLRSLGSDLKVYSLRFVVGASPGWLGGHYADIEFRSSRGAFIGVHLARTLDVLAAIQSARSLPSGGGKAGPSG